MPMNETETRTHTQTVLGREYTADVERMKRASGGWEVVFIGNVRDVATGRLVADGEHRDFIVGFFRTLPYPPGSAAAATAPA